MKKNRKRKLPGVAGSSLMIEEYDESTETDKFIGESTIDVINECLTVEGAAKKAETVVKLEPPPVLGLKPDLLALCTVSEKEHASLLSAKNAPEVVDDLNLEGLDDDEIDGYILTESEAVLKDRLWNKMNAEYLKIAKEREERAAREREEGKPEKKKRRSRKKPIGPSSTALDAIQKVLQEKKISSKINYDILKSLTAPIAEKEEEEMSIDAVDVKPIIVDETLLPRPGTSRKSYFNFSNNRRSKIPQIGFPMATANDDDIRDQIVTDTGKFSLSLIFVRIIYNFFSDDNADADDGMDAEDIVETEPTVDSDRLGNLLNQGDDDEYLGAEEYF